jgi:hypothetical protein
MNNFPFAAKIAVKALPKQVQKHLNVVDCECIDTLIFTQNEANESVIEIESRGRGRIFTWKPIERPSPTRPDITHYWALTEEYEVDAEDGAENMDTVGNRG